MFDPGPMGLKLIDQEVTIKRERTGTIVKRNGGVGGGTTTHKLMQRRARTEIVFGGGYVSDCDRANSRLPVLRGVDTDISQTTTE